MASEVTMTDEQRGVTQCTQMVQTKADKEPRRCTLRSIGHEKCWRHRERG